MTSGDTFQSVSDQRQVENQQNSTNCGFGISSLSLPGRSWIATSCFDVRITMLEVDLMVLLTAFGHAVGVDKEFLRYRMYLYPCIYVDGPSMFALLSEI